MRRSDSRTSLAGDSLSNIHFRNADLTAGTGRTIFGLAIPYNHVQEIHEADGSSFFERFEYGAFARSIQERGSKVKLLLSHDRKRLAIGKATELREEPDGLHTSFEVAQTRDGDEALELVRSGTVDSFSIGFRPLREHVQNGVRAVIEASLWEVSLVNFPAYPGALVGGVRSQSQLLIPRAVAERRLKLLEL